MGVSKLGVAPQYRMDPGRLHDERQAELFGFTEPQRPLQRSPPASLVAAAVAEPRVCQPAVQATMILNLDGVVWSALQGLAGGLAIPAIQPRVRQRDARIERGSRIGSSGRVDGGRDVPRGGVSPRFEQTQPVIEPAGGRPAVPCAADHLRCRPGAAFGQAVARRHEAGRRADQLFRPDSQGGICPLQPVARVVQFVAFEVDKCQRHLGRAAGRPGEPGVRWVRGLGGQLSGAAQPSAHGFHEGQVSVAVATFARAPGGGGGHPGLEARRRLVEVS